MNLKKSVSFLMIIVIFFFIQGCSPNEQPQPSEGLPENELTEPITLKMVSFQALHLPTSEFARKLIEKVEELSNGEIKIQLVGGPEAIAVFDQPEAVKNGVVDLAYTCSSYCVGLQKELLYNIAKSTGSLETRETGLYDYWVNLLENSETFKVRFLGFHEGKPPYNSYYMFTNIKVDKIEDLKGAKIRGVMNYQPFTEAIGANIITMPFPDVYQAMEHGVVDGFWWPIAGGAVYDNSLHEVTKYIINYPLYQTDGIVLANWDTWQNLSKEHQDILIKAQEETELWGYEQYEGGFEGDLNNLLDGGMEIVEFSTEEVEYLNEIAVSSIKEYAQKEIGPEATEELFELLTKRTVN